MRTSAGERKYLRTNCKICELCEKLRSARSQICAKIARQGKICEKLQFCAKRRNLRKNCAPQDRDFLQGLMIHMFKTFNKISRLNSYILFGSVHCSRQSSNRNIYVVPVHHLNTGIRIQGPININISLNWKKYVIITIIRLIINYLIFTTI